MAYGEISSSLYYALGITAVYALSLTPVVFAAAGFLFALAAAAYAEGGATIPEPGGASAFARRAFNDLVGFIAGWATVLDFVLAISLSALFLPYYVAGALGQYGWFHGQPGRATAVAVAIVLVVTVIRMLRRTDAYTIGVVVAALDLVLQVGIAVFGLVAPVLGRRAQEQHRPRRGSDLELPGVRAPDRDDRLHRPREGRQPGRCREEPREEPSRRRSHVGVHRRHRLQRGCDRRRLGVPSAPGRQQVRRHDAARHPVGGHADARAGARDRPEGPELGRDARSGSGSGSPPARSSSWPSRPASRAARGSRRRWGATRSSRRSSAARAGACWPRRRRSSRSRSSRSGSSSSARSSPTRRP